MPRTARKPRQQPKAPVIAMPLIEGNAAWYHCKVERAKFYAALSPLEREYGWLLYEDDISEDHRAEIAGLLMGAEDAVEEAKASEERAADAETTSEDLASALRFVLEDGNTELDHEARTIIEAALAKAGL